MICRICKERFEAEEAVRRYDTYPYEDGCVEQVTGLVCPACGSEEVYDECGCRECGEELPSSELHDGLCLYCLEELTETLEWMWSMLSPSQKQWAAHHHEWMEE